MLAVPTEHGASFDKYATAIIGTANPLPDLLMADGCHPRRSGSNWLCLCPFHAENTPSFNVYPKHESWRFKCFGCNVKGDVFDYVKRRNGIGFVEARNWLSARAGFPRSTAALHSPNLLLRSHATATKPSGKMRTLPIFRTSRTGELNRLSTLRNLSMDGVRLAESRGLLRFGRACGFNCWIVTDAASLSSQARRMDGESFPAVRSLAARKTHTIRGSQAAHPVGLREAEKYGTIAVVEGGPDLLAACHFITVEERERDVAPVAMLGAALTIRPESLLRFEGKRVRIFGHLDRNGAKATLRWTMQLREAGAIVDAFDFAGLWQTDGSSVGDLNDFARIHGDCYEAERGSLESIMP